MDYFLNTARQLGEYRQAAGALLNAENALLPTMVTGISHIQKAHFIAAFSGEEISGAVLVLVESENVGAKLCDDINTMSGKPTALLYPAKDMSLTEVVAVSREYEHRRINVLYKLLNEELKFVVATPEAAAQLTIPKTILTSTTIVINGESEIHLDSFTRSLTEAGFSRCDMIEGKSQFSVRGSIIDVFPINSAYPIRIELWGDNVDSISYFDLETQRRLESVSQVEIAPAMEVLYDKQTLALALEAFAKKVRGKKAEEVKKHLRTEIERLNSDISPLSPDRYYPLCYDSSIHCSLFDYVDRIIICEHNACSDLIKGTLIQHTEDLKLLTEDGILCHGLDRYMLTKEEYKSRLEADTRLYFDTFMRGGDIKLQKLLNLESVQLSAWGGELKVLREELSGYIKRGYSVIVFAGTEKASKTLAEDLRDDNIPADYSDSPSKVYAKKVYVTHGTLSSGFEYPEAKYACLSHALVTRSDALPGAKKKRKKAEIINSLTDINIGDVVVHNSYGIGVFEGVQQLTGDNVSKDYIKIKYAGTDVLYVPVTQLDLISRYIGSADASNVRLNKLHSDKWQNSKAKAKSAAKEMAGELIELYAKRMHSKGFAFSPDGTEQEDFENHFSFIETDDQMRCAAEIKSDMERAVPMDRLLCGDVGFGKTEVALRAAFKCLSDGKQCALLCPTTVLAWQHYQTVLKRMEGSPFNIELLSRFRTAKEQKVILEKMKSGVMDMVIGTHRLVQEDIEFRNLGLVIIDEEQRFGVTHKEKFKEMFSGVDVLTLSATPIPRTLNMAMSGIRDMSVIETPPQDRQPITTYVIEHNLGLITQAIYKELRRNGQVYYIHNRIESIYNCAAKLHELCPEARFGIAHGKMDEDELLEVWRKLLQQEIDILVCTTLIETGVDVPNVNTLIIENADYMGLAQLHQLRGRVGRTNRRAFAYFTFKKGKELSEIATKRLEAIREFTQFGSGFRIAMRDLEIRGAGSILGQHQSGHLAEVGYDMYLQLLNEAVQEEQGQQPEIKEECLVDVKIDAFIPPDYISNQAQRIACYRRIAMIRNEDDSMDVTDELIDRYGDVPRAVHGLIEVALLRNMAQKAKITEIVQSGNAILFYTKKPDMQKVALADEITDGRVSINLIGKVNVKSELKRGETPLSLMRTVLTALAGQNNAD